MGLAVGAERRTGRVIEAIARVFAYIGGFILLAMALTTVASIIGRALLSFGLSPVRGDYELVANGCALAVFCFLPFCQLKRGHVTVDIITSAFPLRVQGLFGLIGDALIALVSLVMLRQLWFGFGEKFPYGSDAARAHLGMGFKPFFPETTYELEIPVWIPYGLALIGAALFALVSLYTVWRSVNWFLEGREGAV
jgi:TRAP-type C4-dicarboxylate transport system permease small subunit